MPKKRTSSAKKNAPYSPLDKANIMDIARPLLKKGMSNNAVAKKIGVNPQTLKRWMEDAEAEQPCGDEGCCDTCETFASLDEDYVDENGEPCKDECETPDSFFEEHEDVLKKLETLTENALVIAALAKLIEEVENLQAQTFVLRMCVVFGAGLFFGHILFRLTL